MKCPQSAWADMCDMCQSDRDTGSDRLTVSPQTLEKIFSVLNKHDRSPKILVLMFCVFKIKTVSHPPRQSLVARPCLAWPQPKLAELDWAFFRCMRTASSLVTPTPVGFEYKSILCRAAFVRTSSMMRGRNCAMEIPI